MIATSPHRCRHSATRNTSAIGATNPTELPRSITAHAGMAAAPQRHEHHHPFQTTRAPSRPDGRGKDRDRQSEQIAQQPQSRRAQPFAREAQRTDAAPSQPPGNRFATAEFIPRREQRVGLPGVGSHPGSPRPLRSR